MHLSARLYSAESQKLLIYALCYYYYNYLLLALIDLMSLHDATGAVIVNRYYTCGSNRSRSHRYRY